MKAVVTGLLLAACFASGAQAACSVPNSSSPNFRAALERAGGWPISDEKCNFLRANNLYIGISGMSTVLAFR